MKALLLFVCLGLSSLVSLAQTAPEGIWQGYDGEWKHVSQQLIALAEATPAKIRVAPAWSAIDERSVYAHRDGELLAAERDRSEDADGFERGMEKSVTSKAEVISWLKRSLEAVKEAHLAEKRVDLTRKVHIADRDATVDGMYCASLCMRTSTWDNWSRMRDDWRGTAVVEELEPDSRGRLPPRDRLSEQD